MTHGDVMLSAFGAPVVNRSSSKDDTQRYNGKSLVVNNAELFPRHGEVLGWRAFFTNTEMSVNFQIWRPADTKVQSGKTSRRFQLIGETGPVISPKIGLRVFKMDNLGMEPLPFQNTDTIGVEFETGVPIAFDVRQRYSCKKYVRTASDPISVCQSATLRLDNVICERFSFQALVLWTDKGNAHHSCTLNFVVLYNYGSFVYTVGGMMNDLKYQRKFYL